MWGFSFRLYLLLLIKMHKQICDIITCCLCRCSIWCQEELGVSTCRTTCSAWTMAKDLKTSPCHGIFEGSPILSFFGNNVVYYYVEWSKLYTGFVSVIESSIARSFGFQYEAVAQKVIFLAFCWFQYAEYSGSNVRFIMNIASKFYIRFIALLLGCVAESFVSGVVFLFRHTTDFENVQFDVSGFYELQNLLCSESGVAFLYFLSCLAFLFKVHSYSAKLNRRQAPAVAEQQDQRFCTLMPLACCLTGPVPAPATTSVELSCGGRALLHQIALLLLP